MTPLGNVLIRCDASVRMGTGHAMRCLALAQAWQDAGGHAVFAMAESTPAIEQRIVGEKMALVRVDQGAGSPGDSDRLIELSRQQMARWVVLDGYVFGAEYQAHLHEAGLKLLVVDDDGRAERYVAEMVLNQNPHATVGLYADRAPGTRLQLGPEYALLRREFAQWGRWKRQIRMPAEKVLVTLGGSDPDNVTQRVIEALLAAPEFEAQIVVGGSNPHLFQLREACGTSNGDLHLVHNPGDMAELMAWADVAVAAAGTAAWEIAFMGLPALVIVLADNQQPIANALVDAGAAQNMGPTNQLGSEDIRNRLRAIAASHEVLQKMSARGRALIDGRGAERAVKAMLEREFGTMPIQPTIARAKPS